MSQNPQNPYPHDPFGQEPGDAAPQGEGVPQDAGAPSAEGAPQGEGAPLAADAQQPGAPAGEAAWTAAPGASADPAPHDPAAQDPSTQVPSEQDLSTLPGAPAEGAYDPYAQPETHDPYAAPNAADSDPYGQQSPYGQPTGEQNYYAPNATSGAAGATGPAGGEQSGAGWSAAGGAAAGGAAGGAYAAGQGQGGQQAPAAAAVKGVYDGQLTGQPISDSDSRLWAMFAQLSVVIGHLLSWGFLGWLGPLIIFLVYKDRDRFVRYNAAEALNGAIAVVIAQVVLGVLLGIFGVVTLGFGFALFPLVGVPALLQLIFSIIGAVKANQGQWWNYPVNIRFVR